MTKSKTPRRRQQPSDIGIRWANRGIPDKPAAQRRMLREIARSVDDKAINLTLQWALHVARDSDTRADLAELARLRIAGRRTIPFDEIVYLNDLKPGEAKRLKTMTSAQLKALAKRQAKERARKAVRP